MMNAALVSEPAWCLVGFVICDIGSALVFFLLFSSLDFPVDADFAAAYALSKSIRAPRLAFDAVVAAKMAAAYPPLAAVRMRPILDAGVHAASRVKRAILRIFRVDDRPSAATEPEIAPAKPSAARRAAEEARHLDGYVRSGVHGGEERHRTRVHLGVLRRASMWSGRAGRFGLARGGRRGRGGRERR